HAPEGAWLPPVYPPPFYQPDRHAAGRDAGRDVSISLYRDHGAERPGRRPLETVQQLRPLLLVLRWSRHDRRPTRAARRRAPRNLALGQIISLRSAAAVQNSDLQRDQQGRRQRQCANQHALPAAAQLCWRVAQIYRTELSLFGCGP